MKNSLLLLIITLAIFACTPNQKAELPQDAPNILFIIADDWSYPHAGVYGDTVVQTPNFDRIAREGILFDHAYVSSPSCTPSRAAVLTGQHFWRLGIGANLYGPLPPEQPVYTDLLAKAGYHIGFTKKGWGPGKPEGRPGNPAGDSFDSFDEFIQDRPDGSPFCFWFGSHNPHRGYKKGSGVEAGINPDVIQLAACFPESEEIRSDVADYYKEVQDYDDQIGDLLEELEANGELDNTIIVITSDNGMPFPRSKSNLYDLGTRVPLAIRWGDKIKQPSRSEDFVSLTDLAPTFLDVVDLPIPDEMTGKSLMPYLNGEQETEKRKQIFFGKERHLPAQEAPDWGGYPMRGIRTHDFLYIHNFRPSRWPAGTPNYQKSTFFPSFYGDVDGGPTRNYMLTHRDEDEIHTNLFALSFEKRPEIELYDLKNDPDQLNNIADNPNYEDIKKQLGDQLMEELKQTNDPRVIGDGDVFESYPYTGGTIFPDHFKRSTRRYATVKIDSFSSKYISTRSVEILVPVQVDHDSSFPVIYMFDGQNIFHSFKGWGGEENKGWQVDEVLDSLFVAGSIPQAIVVGIFNGSDRMAEYMPAKPHDLVKTRIEETDHEWYQSFKTDPPASDEQLKFIVEELKPYIDVNFKTKEDQANTFIAGASMGGLLSAYAICEYPEIFGGAACFSTHWPPLDGVFLEYIKTNLPDPATHKIYFDFGTETLDAEYEPFQMIADAAMEARGFEENKNWMTKKFEGAKHHEDDWHARFHIPMEFLLGTLQKK